MKSIFYITGSLMLFFAGLSDSIGQEQDPEGFYIENESEIALRQSGPHDGGGTTIGHSFFDHLEDLRLAFRKRTLKPGSAIGYHLQENDEIYYILHGTGEMKINGKEYKVSTGDAILTRPGNWHGLKPAGNNDLVIFIIYNK